MVQYRSSVVYINNPVTYSDVQTKVLIKSQFSGFAQRGKRSTDVPDVNNFLWTWAATSSGSASSFKLQAESGIRAYELNKSSIVK